MINSTKHKMNQVELKKNELLDINGTSSIYDNLIDISFWQFMVSQQFILFDTYSLSSIYRGAFLWR